MIKTSQPLLFICILSIYMTSACGVPNERAIKTVQTETNDLQDDREQGLTQDGNEAAIKRAILSALSSRTVTARLDAATALRLLPTESVDRCLLRLAETLGPEKRRELPGLIAVMDHSAVRKEALIRLSSDAVAEVRTEAANALGMYMKDKDVLTRLLSMLNDDDLLTRLMSANVLATSGEHRGRRMVMQLSAEGPLGERTLAIQHLALLSTQFEDCRVLLNKLGKDNDERVRRSSTFFEPGVLLTVDSGLPSLSRSGRCTAGAFG